MNKKEPDNTVAFGVLIIISLALISYSLTPKLSFLF